MTVILDSSNGVYASYNTTKRLMFKGKDILGNPVYLHFCRLDWTTKNWDEAWIGTKAQALNVRKKYPHTKSMKLVTL